MPKQSKLGDLDVTSGQDSISTSRAAILIWGNSSVGKTTWAATAPGNKLFLSLGDNEHVPIARRKDVRVVHLYKLGTNELFNKARVADNPFGLDDYLHANEDIETVILDSVTALVERALQSAIEKNIGRGKDFTPTTEMPGLSAYGARNGVAIEVLRNIMRVTAKYNVNIVLTAHEDDPVMKDTGRGTVVDHIGIALGGKIVSQTTHRLSEIWYMGQETTGNENRYILVRPARLRKPMKTRIFVTDEKAKQFALDYDPSKPDKGQITIASIVDSWMKAKGERIALPKKRIPEQGKVATTVTTADCSRPTNKGK